MRKLGLLGGTFDPVHHGHLRLAIEMQEALGLDALRFVPAAVPPLRDRPAVSAELRLRMLRAAVRGLPAASIDERELRRSGVSYTLDTLRSIREELDEECALCLILGMDAFSGLDRWSRWQEIPTLAHICVARRPGAAAPAGAPAALLEERGESDPRRLGESAAGRVCVRDIPALDISATRVRELIATGRSARFLLPDGVIDLIEENRLYRD